MKIKKISMILSIGFLLIAVSGCQSVFYTYDEAYAVKTKTAPAATITSYAELGNGTLKDVSTDGKTLLAFNVSDTLPVTYTIEIFNYETNKWQATNLITSEKKLYDGVLSEKEQGFYYTEAIMAPAGNVASMQLVWASLDGATSRVLTDQNEHVTSNLCVISDGGVLYSNDRQEVVMVHANDSKKVYGINDVDQIQDIFYDAQGDRIFFTALRENDTTLNLYQAKLTAEPITPTLVAANVTAFDCDLESGTLYYLQQSGTAKKLCRMHLENNALTTIDTDRFERITATGNEEPLIYTLSDENETNPLECIYVITEKNKKTATQITSPKALTGKIFTINHQIFYTSVMDDVPTIYALSWEILSE